MYVRVRCISISIFRVPCTCCQYCCFPAPVRALGLHHRHSSKVVFGCLPACLLRFEVRYTTIRRFCACSVAVSGGGVDASRGLWVQTACWWSKPILFYYTYTLCLHIYSNRRIRIVCRWCICLSVTLHHLRVPSAWIKTIERGCFGVHAPPREGRHVPTPPPC